MGIQHWSDFYTSLLRFLVPVFLSGAVIVLATDLRAHPLRSRVFLSGLFGRLDSYFFRVILSLPCSSNWQVLRHLTYHQLEVLLHPGA